MSNSLRFKAVGKAFAVLLALIIAFGTVGVGVSAYTLADAKKLPCITRSLLIRLPKDLPQPMMKL